MSVAKNAARWMLGNMLDKEILERCMIDKSLAFDDKEALRDWLADEGLRGERLEETVEEAYEWLLEKLFEIERAVKPVYREALRAATSRRGN